MQTTTQLREQAASKVSSPETFEILCEILDAMDRHHLEASGVDQDEDGVAIEWISEFNKGNIVTLTINADGTVLGIAMGSAVKVWTVAEYEMTSHPALCLSLAETLEYIRHFIWANHNV